MSVAQRTMDAVDAATTSCERVKASAKELTDSISQRAARARTDPFLKVEDEFEKEDSLVTSIENVIAMSSPNIEVKNEE